MHFIHAADLHLDRPYEGLASYPKAWAELISQAPYLSLERLIDAAIFDQVDAVLLAGDLYDGENRTVKAQHFLYEQLERLNSHDIPAFIIHGNHDPLLDQPSPLPSNCHLFSAEVESFYFTTKAKERVAVSGFSYAKRWVEENMTRYYPKRADHVDYHLGLYHGQVVRTSQTNPYAPFDPADIDRLNYDYFALGHIHQQTQLASQTPAYYAGSLCGRSIKETGPKGYLDIMLDGQDADIIPIAVSPVEWCQLAIPIKDIVHWQQALDDISQHIAKQQFEADYIFLALQLDLDRKLADDLARSLEQASFFDLLQDQLQAQGIYLFDLKLNQKAPEELEELKRLFPKEFSTAYQTLLQADQLKQLGADLFEDQRIKKWLEKESFFEEEEWKGLNRDED